MVAVQAQLIDAQRPEVRTPVQNHPRVNILGIPVSAINMTRAVEIIGGWIAQGRSAYVAVADVHSVMRGVDTSEHADALAQADMVAPDGKPLSVVGRLRGHRTMSQVCGPELLPAIMAQSAQNGWTHYFYGGADGVAADLVTRMRAQFPGVEIVGHECPPFRSLTMSEKLETAARIRESGADIVWVGLGCPKQERWMLENTHRLPGQVLIGIGAAFDFHTGRVARAPRWLRDSGLEWLHRLASNPARLWRRYLVHAPRFVMQTLAESMQPVRPKF